MSLSLENPFVNDGSIAEGDRFIDRKASLQVVEGRVISPPEPGNLAIIGLPRIGKSSLAHKAIIERKQELLARKFLPIWINLPVYTQVSAFFHALVKQCADELQTLGWLTPAMQSAGQRALQEEISASDGYRRIQRFFEKVRQAGVRVIFVLDDFDTISQLFKEANSDMLSLPAPQAGLSALYNKLAELSDHPAWRVTFVTTSRRPIHEIEQARPQGRPQGHPVWGTGMPLPRLARLFHEHYLTMFDEHDLQGYFARLAAIGMTVTPALKEDVDFYCGGHPYLLELLGHEIVAQFREKQQEDVNLAARHTEPTFTRYYDQLLGMLREDGMLSTFLQILFNPRSDVNPHDRDEMLRYGLIKSTQQDAATRTFSAFSTRFQVFLRGLIYRASTEQENDPRANELGDTINRPPTEQETRETLPRGVPESRVPIHWHVEPIILPGGQVMRARTDLWALWQETEKTLRAALTSVLQEKYGEDWFEKLELAHPGLSDKDGKDMFQRCRESRQRDEVNWGSRAFQSMLEFSAPQDLLALASVEWDTFQAVFGHDPGYWQRRNQLLGTVRVLLAHNREEAVYDHERQFAEAYCKEILNTLQAWREPEKTPATTREFEPESRVPIILPGGQVMRARTDLWALWRETEKALRTVIVSVLRKKHGENWFAQVEVALPNLAEKEGKSMFQRCREVYQRETQMGGVRFVESLLDFAYVEELFALVFAEWDAFEPIFGKDWLYWRPRAQFFAMMRNPLAHNRQEAIFGEKREMAEEYCREILTNLRNHLDNA